MSHGVTENTADLDLHRRVGRPQRGDQRHLRHDGRVLRQQRRATRATTSSARRSTSTATARRCATWTSRARTARSQGLLVLRRSAASTRTTRRARSTTGSTWPPRASGAKTINGVSYNSPTCNGSTVTGIGRDKASQDLVPHAVDVPDLRQQLRGAPAPVPSSRPRTSTAPPAPSAPASRSVHRASRCRPGPRPAVARRRRPPAATCWPTPASSPARPAGRGTTGADHQQHRRPAHTGCWKAWLGGNGTTAHRDDLAVGRRPVHRTAPTLSFWLRTDTAETRLDGLRHDEGAGRQRHDTTTLATYSNVDAKATYAQKSLNLSAYKGKTSR